MLGMSDVMPYPSLRYTILTDDRADMFIALESHR